MRAVRYDRFTGVDGLSVDDVPDPLPAAGEVLVNVVATGINPATVAALHGAPYTPGRDLAGDVVALGEHTETFRVGDAVLGRVQSWWAHAELVAVPAEQLITKPPALPYDVAGCLYTGAMAGAAAVRAVRPRPGELLVVCGAAGAVGLTAAQLAHRDGAEVLGLAGADRAPWLREHGITPVTYGDGQRERINTAARGRPITAFVDTAGHGAVALARDLGVSDERINTVVDFAAARDSAIHTMGTADAGGADTFQTLANLVADGALDFPVAATFPLSHVQRAYRALTTQRLLGRIVLHPQDDRR